MVRSKRSREKRRQVPEFGEQFVVRLPIPWWARLWGALAFEFGWTNRRWDEEAYRLREPYRSRLGQGLYLCREIQQNATRLPRPLRRVFGPLARQARELVSDLEHLERSAQQIDDYLCGPLVQSSSREVERLRAELAVEKDPIIRGPLEQALLAMGEAVADQEELWVLHERAEAEAVCINASLQSVLSEIIKQQHSDLETASQEFDVTAERLRSVKSRVEAIQQVITTRSSSGGHG